MNILTCDKCNDDVEHLVVVHVADDDYRDNYREEKWCLRCLRGDVDQR